jgi:hypothetical protein
MHLSPRPLLSASLRVAAVFLSPRLAVHSDLLASPFLFGSHLFFYPLPVSGIPTFRASWNTHLTRSWPTRFGSRAPLFLIHSVKISFPIRVAVITDCRSLLQPSRSN